jgi:hypothetical protein
MGHMKQNSSHPLNSANQLLVGESIHRQEDLQPHQEDLDDRSSQLRTYTRYEEVGVPFQYSFPEIVTKERNQVKRAFPSEARKGFIEFQRVKLVFLLAQTLTK